jgi:hypothetical protein
MFENSRLIHLLADMPAKRKAAAGKASGAQNAAPKVTRTPKGPFQASKKGEEFFPEEIKAKRLEYGIPKYEVKWQGYDDCPEQNTWEPLEHLVGFEDMVRDFEIWWEEEYKRKQEETQIELKRRKELKTHKEQEEAIIRASLPDAVDEDEDSLEEVKGGKGRKKRSALWQSSCYTPVLDTAGRTTHGRCMLQLFPPDDGDDEDPSPKECTATIVCTNGSSTNMWKHLEQKHPAVYARLKWVSDPATPPTNRPVMIVQVDR